MIDLLGYVAFFLTTALIFTLITLGLIPALYALAYRVPAPQA